MKKITNSTVRLALPDDASEIVHLTKAINEESDYGLVYNEENSFKYIYNHIYYDGCAIAVAEKDDEIIGYVILARSLEYHDRPFCYIGKFFVFLSGRRTDASRKLAAYALKWAKEQDCSHVFATATAGLEEKEQQLFINLMKKSGLVEHGPVLSLKME